MSLTKPDRRILLATGGALIGAGLVGLRRPVFADSTNQGQTLAATPTMRGGANNYHPGAPVVERIGGGGFLMTGRVRRAGDGAPLPGRRIQMWAHTTEGHERDPQSHGATLTRDDGFFELDMPQIVPAFGQAHGHLAYDAEHDDPSYQTVFLRPIMASASDTTLHVEFVLQPV